MSTPMILGRAHGDGFTDATYVHWNGYPTHAGPALFWLIEHTFKGDIERALSFITKPKYWSVLAWDGFEEKMAKDGDYAEIYNEPRWTYSRGVGLCDLNPGDWPRPNWSGGPLKFDAAFIYVIDPAAETLMVGYPEYDDNDEATPVFTAVVRIGDPDVDWARVECGQNFERCSHCCYVHFPDAPEGSHRLSTAKYLGREPLEFEDAVGLYWKDRYYRLTGSGSLERRTLYNQPDGHGLLGVKTGYGSKWFACLETDDGQRLNMHVWSVYKTVPHKVRPGITLVYPPIREEVQA